MIDIILDNNSVLNVYRYGSVVYKTTDSLSDEDWIVIVDNDSYERVNYLVESFINTQEDIKIDITLYTIDEFIGLLQEHEISAIECMYLDSNHILKEDYKFDFVLDYERLRRSISTKSNNSWVKAKKKLLIEKDYNLRVALKSLYHSIRILDFGIQLSKYNKIKDYTSSNYIIKDLNKLASRIEDPIQLWLSIYKQYKSLYNVKKTKFKILCPINKQKKT